MQVVHVEIVRAYGRLVRLVLQYGQLLRKLQCETAALQREAQLWEEVPVATEAACYKTKEEIDRISQEIQVGITLVVQFIPRVRPCFPPSAHYQVLAAMLLYVQLHGCYCISHVT
jgi:hypothetical protein